MITYRQYTGRYSISTSIHLYLYSVYNIQIQQVDDLFILLFHQDN